MAIVSSVNSIGRVFVKHFSKFRPWALLAAGVVVVTAFAIKIFKRPQPKL